MARSSILEATEVVVVCLARGPDDAFDPEMCPLLVGLSPAERARRMQQPWMQACMRQGKAPGPAIATCDGDGQETTSRGSRSRMRVAGVRATR